MNMGDASVVVASAKLAGLVELSNEMVADAAINLTAALTGVLRDTFSADLDRGVLYGDAPPEPIGVYPTAPAAAGGPDLRSAAITAWSELVAAGARADQVVVFAHPATVGTEWARVADTSGMPLHGDSATGDLTLGPGITVVPVPVMQPADVLAVDVSAVYLVVRQDFTVDLSPDAGFERDVATLRIKGRFAVAAPAPDKSLRKVTITPGAQTTRGAKS
jgi:HK97 family phage major capsid protein